MKPTYTPQIYPWFAVQTRARYENFAAKQLGGRGYEVFLPLYPCKRRWSDRMHEFEMPLFPGYLFCRFNLLDRLPIHPWPFLKVGEIVRVEEGPLRGLEGVLLNFKGRYRLVLSVTLLQRSVAVEVESAWVTRLPQQPVRTAPIGSIIPT